VTSLSDLVQRQMCGLLLATRPDNTNTAVSLPARDWWDSIQPNTSPIRRPWSRSRTVV